MNEASGAPLSAAAAARLAAALPALLDVVRWRRRRRQATRAFAAILMLGGLLTAVWFHGVGNPPRPAPSEAPPVAVAPPWTEVGDDPTILARCEVVTSERAEWFLDDDGLQQWLRAAARPAGLVRVGAEVRASPGAIDSFPSPSP